MEHSQNLDKLVEGFLGNTLKGKVGGENFDESIVSHQTFPRQSFVLHIHSHLVYIFGINIMLSHFWLSF